MAETRTEIKVDIYSGVPFNTKYQNVLFVDKQTRDLFLSQYSVGNEITVGRFDIINDNQAIIDISNDYGTMSVNYIKVHKTLRPETSNSTFEYDMYYFVDHTLQIATNAVRLFLDLDIFQTYFVKYNYQTETYEIPQIKNSRCEISTDFAPTEKMTVLDPTNFDGYADMNELFAKVQNYNRVHAVIHFTSTNGEYTAISKYAMAMYPATSSYPYDLKTFLSTIYSKQKFYFDSSLQDINAINVYLIPDEMISSATFDNFSTGYYSYTLGGNQIHAEYYVSSNLGIPAYEYNANKLYSPKITKQCSIGTLNHQIDVPYISKEYSINVKFIFGNTFQCFLSTNNQIIEITNDFEYTLLESAYAEYMQSHTNGLAIKNISNAINMISSITGLVKGSAGSIVSLTQTMSNIAGEYASIIDLQNQPLKINATTSTMTNILCYNGIGIFENQPSNKLEIEKTEKYFGYKMNFLTSKTFSFMSANSNKNFDYYKFSNVEITGKLQESFKTRFEQMFLNGVRFWYTTSKFLDTIENTEQQNQ